METNRLMHTYNNLSNKKSSYIIERIGMASPAASGLIKIPLKNYKKHIIDSKLRAIDPFGNSNWDDLVSSVTNSSIFHSSAWTRVLYETYGYKPCFFILYKGDHPAALIPLLEVNSYLTGRRGVSLPFSDYCGPILVRPGLYDEIFTPIIDYAYRRKWRYVELRGGGFLFPGKKAYSIYSGHLLDLQKKEKALLQMFRDSTRRNIKKAVKKGVQVKISSSLESLKDFYHLHCITRKHHCVPPQPFSFFKKLHTYIIAKGQGRIFLAIFKDKAIAGDICLHFGTGATYKYGASDRKYQDLRASNLLMWEMIKYYSAQGFSTLDLGRTDPKNSGLLQFKNGWGCKQFMIPYYRYDLNNRCFVTSREIDHKIVNNILKKSPVFTLRTIGKILYRHLG